MPGLARKPELVCANKMDEPNAAENLKALQKKVPEPIYPISCVSDEGLPALKEALLKAVLAVRAAEAEAADAEPAD
jgi:GTP-binding protein